MNKKLGTIKKRYEEICNIVNGDGKSFPRYTKHGCEEPNVVVIPWKFKGTDDGWIDPCGDEWVRCIINSEGAVYQLDGKGNQVIDLPVVKPPSGGDWPAAWPADAQINVYCDAEGNLVAGPAHGSGQQRFVDGDPIGPVTYVPGDCYREISTTLVNGDSCGRPLDCHVEFLFAGYEVVLQPGEAMDMAYVISISSDFPVSASYHENTGDVPLAVQVPGYSQTVPFTLAPGASQDIGQKLLVDAGTIGAPEGPNPDSVFGATMTIVCDTVDQQLVVTA